MYKFAKNGDFLQRFKLVKFNEDFCLLHASLKTIKKVWHLKGSSVAK